MKKLLLSLAGAVALGFSASATEVTVDFTNPESLGVAKAENGKATVVETFTFENIKVDIKQGADLGDGQELRFFTNVSGVVDFRTSANGGKKGHVFTVSTTGDENITQIVFDGKNLNVTAAPGTVNTTDKIWTGDAKEIAFTTTGAVNLNKMVITLGGETASTNGINESFASIPDTWTNVKVSGDKEWYSRAFNNVTYATMTGFNGTQPPFDAWLISPVVDITAAAEKILTFKTQVNGYGSTTSVFEVYVLNSTDPVTATKAKLNPTIAVAPEEGYSEWVESGNIDLSEYAGNIYIGFRFYATEAANYATWCVTDVKLNSAAAPVEPGEPEPPTTGKGSKEDPYSVAEVIANGTDKTVADVWMGGYIVGYVNGQKIDEGATFTAEGCEVKTNLLLAATADCKDVAACVPVQLPAGDERNALNLVENAANLGKYVILNGNIEKYFGVAGFKTVKAHEFTEAPEPGEPEPGALYTGLVANCDDWTLDADATIPEGITYVWSWKEYNGAGYLNASAFNKEIFVATAWAVSPVIDLTAAAGASLNFDHAAKFQTTLKELCGLYVKEEGAADWTELTIPAWPEAGAWTFVNSDEIALADYCGKKVQFGFKYGSTAEGADTWEIKNFIIKDGSTAIENVEASENAPVEYYNLQGIRVANPENGIFIRRQGNTVTKVLVK